jgi:hypothetical protein
MIELALFLLIERRLQPSADAAAFRFGVAPRRPVHIKNAGCYFAFLSPCNEAARLTLELALTDPKSVVRTNDLL